MRYMLLICSDETYEPTPEENTLLQKSTWPEDMDARGVRLHGSRLRPVSEATTVSVRDAKVMVSDGPFAETKEQVAGYDIIECEDLDEAIEVASQHPVARIGSVEIRPLWGQ